MLLLVHLLPVLLLFACTQPPFGPEKPLMPLGENYSWRYDTSFEEQGERVHAALVFTVDRQQIRAGQTYHHLQMRAEIDGTEVAPDSELLVRHAENGVEWLTFEGGMRTDSLFFRYPVGAGTRYAMGEAQGRPVHAVVHQARITVPAGTFDAVLYRFDSLGDDIEYAFAPGVGLLRVMVESPNPENDSHFDLLSYVVGEWK